MNAISVGYRFFRDELSTILQAMRIDGLPGAPLKPVDGETARRVLDHLSAEGLAVIADDTLYIDKLTDFLLRAAARPKSAVVITDEACTAVLWQAEKFLILGDFAPNGECALIPLQDADAARSALTDVIFRMKRPLRGMNVFAPDRRVDFPVDSPLTNRQIALEVAALMADSPIF